MPYTITFSERNRNENPGWTSFWSYYPGQMMALGNRFYTLKDGQLWEHNDENNPNRAFIYGQKVIAKIVAIFNQEPSDDKVFKTLIYEGNAPWKAKLKTNLTETSLAKEEFEAKESRWFAYIRGTENQDDLHGMSVQGIGNIQSIVGNTINFESIPNSISIGDNLFQISNGEKEALGDITDHTPTSITLSALATPPVDDNFCFTQKNNRIEGSEIRGYFMEVELENSDTKEVELFAVNTNAIKSYI